MCLSHLILTNVLEFYLLKRQSNKMLDSRFCQKAISTFFKFSWSYSYLNSEHQLGLTIVEPVEKDDMVDLPLRTYRLLRCSNSERWTCWPLVTRRLPSPGHHYLWSGWFRRLLQRECQLLRGETQQRRGRDAAETRQRRSRDGHDSTRWWPDRLPWVTTLEATASQNRQLGCWARWNRGDEGPPRPLPRALEEYGQGTLAWSRSVVVVVVVDRVRRNGRDSGDISI